MRSGVILSVGGVTADLCDVHTSATSATGTASASSNYVGYDAYIALDGSTGVGNVWATAGAPAVGDWWKYELTNAKTITEYWMQANNEPTYHPNGWELQGSNNNVDWSVMDTQTSISWSASLKREYTASNPGAYKYVRFYFTEVPATAYLYVSELMLRGY